MHAQLIAPIDVIQLLIELNPDAVTSGRTLPLHNACGHRNPSIDIIQLLLTHYPESISVPNMGNMHNLPLHIALRKEAPDEEVVMALLDHFEDGAKHITTYGNLPLHLACSNSASLAVLERLVEIYPRGLYTRSEFGEIPLHIACMDLGSGSSLEIVKFLVELYPESAQYKGFNGSLPLHFAASSAPVDVVRFLAKGYPGGVSAVDMHGSLPFHKACTTPHTPREQVVRLLIDSCQGSELHHSGASVPDSAGQLPLHFAAVWDSTLETLELLLECYPEGVRVVDDEGMLPLHNACILADSGIACIRRLIEANLFTVIQKTNDGQTAFELARSRDMDSEDVLFFEEKQNEAVRAIREAFDDAVDTQLGLPDLVIANIWSFVKPDLWCPPE